MTNIKNKNKKFTRDFIKYFVRYCIIILTGCLSGYGTIFLKAYSGKTTNLFIDGITISVLITFYLTYAMTGDF